MNNIISCSLCSSTHLELVCKSLVFQRIEAKLYKCTNCQLTFFPNPSWLNEAYSSVINNEDTGILERNVYFAWITSLFLKCFVLNRPQGLDFAGGYGIFVRLMRNKKFDIWWQDKFCKNIFSPEYCLDLSVEKNRFDYITAFEVLEHLDDVQTFFSERLSEANTLITSTLLYDGQNLQDGKWWYLGLNHGQHITFFSNKTMHFIAAKFNVYYYDFCGLHIFSRNKINLIKFNLVRSATKIVVFVCRKLGLF